MATEYRVILADPPWKYQRWNDEKSQRPDHYPRMTIEQLCALDVRRICADDCALFMWTVDWLEPKQAQAVMEAWGFTYRTKAWTWVKANRRTGTGFHMGMGKYTRSNTEECWLGVRGDMPVAAHNVLGLIYTAVRAHSRKPDEQYAKIERLYPQGPYLEMFARRCYSSRWHVWGNQLTNDLEIPQRRRRHGAAERSRPGTAGEEIREPGDVSRRGARRTGAATPGAGTADAVESGSANGLPQLRLEIEHR